MKNILLILLMVVIYAGNVNNDILLIEAKLYPKILYLMDDFCKKKNINIAIITNDKTIKMAKKLKDLIKNEKIKINLINKINLNYDAYVLTLKDFNKKDLKLLLNNKKVIFSIYPNYVKNAIFSIYIGARIYPYINPYLLNEAKISFNPIILKIGKIYEK